MYVTEDRLPWLLHALLSALGFEEPSWLSLFVLIVGLGFLAVAIVAVRALIGGLWDP